MKIVKYLFFLLLIAIIAGALYIATLDGDFQVEENRVVDAPAEMLFEEVNDYTTWEKWNPNTADQVITYADTTTGKGAGYTWESPETDGSIKTTAVIPGKSIEQEIRFETLFGEVKSQMYWKFEPLENGTEVTWGIKGEQDFWEKAYALTRDSSLTEQARPELKKGLQNLEKQVKKAMQVYNIHVDGLTHHSGGFYMYMSTASRNTPEALRAKMAKILPQVSLYMQKNNIEMSGAPMTIYNSFDEQNGTVIFSTGIPAPTRIITPEDSEILCGYLPSLKVVKTTLKGNYSHLPEAWEAAKQFMMQNGYEANKTANPFEVYVTNPGEVKNPAEWVTEVYLPIQ